MRFVFGNEMKDSGKKFELFWDCNALKIQLLTLYLKKLEDKNQYRNYHLLLNHALTVSDIFRPEDNMCFRQ